MNDKSGLIFIGVGFELAVMVLAGFYVGDAVDKYYELGGKGVYIVVAACLISWGVHFTYLIRKFMKDAEEYEKEHFKDKDKS